MPKKIILVLGLVILLGGFFYYEKFVVDPADTTIIISDRQTDPLPKNNLPIQENTQKYKDGIYNGKETSSIYGKAKVQVVISSGKIVDVKFLVFPNDRQTTIEISNSTMPIIKQEVIRVQSANVDTVSGATQTAESFIESIASALAKAS